MYRAISHHATANYRQSVAYDDPTPAYTELRRTKSSIPRRIIRRITHSEEYDPSTIPVQTRREQRRAEKREQRKLEELNTYQRKQFQDKITRQLEQHERETGIPPAKKSIRIRIRNTLKRKKPEAEPIVKAQAPNVLNDFSTKNDLASWFDNPGSVVVPQSTTIEESFPAELDDTAIAHPQIQSGFSIDGDIARSASPCLSSIPQRGMTINEIPTISSKQMQCDSCHDAIKMTGYHYACNFCNDGDCLYCDKCTKGGRTCRHELHERTRNIKRHPTNPKTSARSSTDMASTFSTAELSAIHPHSMLLPLNTDTSTKDKDVKVSPSSPVDLLRAFETQRREQEMAYREKEVSLREREAMLREREAWTATRERDAALVQQLHAAAILQRNEVGSQFSPVSPLERKLSNYSTASRRSSFVKPGFAQFMSRTQSAQSQAAQSPTTIEGPSAAVCTAMHNVEASFADLQIDQNKIRSHAGSTKRKAVPPRHERTNSSSSKNSNRKDVRKPSRDRDQDNDEDEDGDLGSPKRQKQDESDLNRKLFACPYYKHNPTRYAERNTHETNYRTCATGLFRDMSRVKQHLKRVHHRPMFYCRRCFDIFENNEDLQVHSSSRESCDVQACPYPEKLDETQQAKIHVKRPNKDPKELWFDLYGIIFPGHPLPETPYIEPAQTLKSTPTALETFIDLFNARLDLNPSSPTWLQMPTMRQWLTQELNATAQEMQQTMRNSNAASAILSPISPGQSFQQSRSSSCSSQEEITKLHPSHAMRSNLRPALKVTTAVGSRSSSSQCTSSKSTKQQFPFLANHVRDDIGYNNGAGESWISGDDSSLMVDTNMYLQEPGSATSTRSTKSVSFATPPDAGEVENFDDQQLFAPTFLDIASVDWSTQPFTRENYKHNRADSAYGTLSSAQNSRTSLFRPQSQSGRTSDEQLTCVDPSKLFVTSGNDMTGSGLSADVQAYFNRNMMSHIQ